MTGSCLPLIWSFNFCVLNYSKYVCLLRAGVSMSEWSFEKYYAFFTDKLCNVTDFSIFLRTTSTYIPHTTTLLTFLYIYLLYFQI
jgi:hypothetical protein